MQCAATCTILLISRSTLQLSSFSDAAPQNNKVATQPFVSNYVFGLVTNLTLHANNDSISDLAKVSCRLTVSLYNMCTESVLCGSPSSNAACL